MVGNISAPHVMKRRNVIHIVKAWQRSWTPTGHSIKQLCQNKWSHPVANSSRSIDVSFFRCYGYLQEIIEWNPEEENV